MNQTVLAWGIHLRDLRYLSDPKADTKLHTSMSGVEFDEQLVYANHQQGSHGVQHVAIF